MHVRAVFLGGFLGTLSRVLLAQAIQGRFGQTWPLDIFVINISGALVLGFFAHVIEEGAIVPPAFRLFFASGFLGAYTTFSSFEYGTATLLLAGRLVAALAYFAGSLVVGLVAVYLGRVLARSTLVIRRRVGRGTERSLLYRLPQVTYPEETLLNPEGEGE